MLSLISNPFEFVALGLTLVIAIGIHEFAHALVADYLGDPTPRSQGRVTLNPLAHLDFLGSLLILVAGFGWGKPVMVNPRNFRNGPVMGNMVVAAAGPLSNLGLAILAAIPFRLGFGAFPLIRQAFWVFVFLNVLLFLFNLLPLHPLDGFKVALGLLPREWGNALARTQPYGMLILIGIFFLDWMLPFSIIGALIFNPAASLTSLLLGV